MALRGCSWLVALTILVSVSTSAHADFSGKVVGIMDGDTIDVLVDRTPIRVRLAEIDAPERRQAFGQRARQFLANAVFNRVVMVQESSRDRYGRVLGTVYLVTSLPGVSDSPPLNINGLMVREGMAWAYRHYLKDQMLLAAESDARAKKKGLWADGKQPVAPWEWRVLKRTERPGD